MKEKKSISFTARGDRRNAMPPTPGGVASFCKNSNPGSRRYSCTHSEVRLCSCAASTPIDLSLASCCNYLTLTSELRVLQFIVAIFAWLSLRELSPWRATNREEYSMLFGVIDFFLACLASLLLKPWCTIIEPSEIEKEWK